MLNTIIIAAISIGVVLVSAMVVVLVIADRRNRQFESKPIDTSYGYETEKYAEPPETRFEGIDSSQVSESISRLTSLMKRGKGGCSIGLLLFGMVFAIGEVVLIGLGVRMVTLSKASLDWPTVTGTVLSSQVDEEYDSEDDDYAYYPRVEYRYVVDGQAYESDRVFFGSDNTPEEDAYAIVAQFPAGTTAAVYYNPNRPKQSVLIPGGEYAPGYLIIIGAISLVITAITFGVMLFNAKRGGVAGADQP